MKPAKTAIYLFNRKPPSKALIFIISCLFASFKKNCLLTELIIDVCNQIVNKMMRNLCNFCIWSGLYSECRQYMAFCMGKYIYVDNNNEQESYRLRCGMENGTRNENVLNKIHPPHKDIRLTMILCNKRKLFRVIFFADDIFVGAFSLSSEIVSTKSTTLYCQNILTEFPHSTKSLDTLISWHIHHAQKDDNLKRLRN